MTGRTCQLAARVAAAIVSVAAIGLLLVPRADACSQSQFEVTEKGELPRYTLVLFYKPGPGANNESLAVLKKLEAKWAKRANVDFESVDASTERGGKIAKYWEIPEFPFAYILSPMGGALATFKGKLSEADVEPFMTSPGKAALLDALAKNKAAFLILGRKKMAGYDEALKTAKAAAKGVKEAMKVTVATVEVDPTDAREAKLLQNLGFEKAPEAATVIVTYGKGRAVLQDVVAENTEERLAFTIRLLATADQCSLGQEIRGEPLLLGK